MRKRDRMWAAAAALALTTWGALPSSGRGESEAADGQYQLVEAWPGVAFDQPIDLAFPADGTDRVFVAQRGGKILSLAKYRGSGPVAQPKVFLDLGPLLAPEVLDQGQGGLLSLAFHPDYAKNGRFFVFYGTGAGTPQDPYRSVIASYKASATNPDQADPASGVQVLAVSKRQMIHFGGGLAFGKDGMLYVGIGDTGMKDDPERVAQDTRTLEGKILRLDVTNAPAGQGYGIPADNPWPAVQGVRPEIFAYGVRNPFRMTFDRGTGALWMGDPGQKLREEVDVVPRAGNLGWGIMEGDQPLAPGANPSQYVAPVFAYGREGAVSGSCSVGGQTYRGQRCPALVGKHVFADHMSGKMWALPLDANNKLAGAPTDVGACEAVAAIKEDAQGELYVAALDGGKVFTITP